MGPLAVWHMRRSMTVPEPAIRRTWRSPSAARPTDEAFPAARRPGGSRSRALRDGALPRGRVTVQVTTKRDDPIGNTTFGVFVPRGTAAAFDRSSRASSRREVVWMCPDNGWS